MLSPRNSQWFHLQQARDSARLALGYCVWLCFDELWPWLPNTKQRLGHNSLCSRRLPANCQTTFSKINLLSALTSFSLAFSFQAVGVNLLKSPLSACGKSVFKRGKSQASPRRVRHQEAGSRVASTCTQLSPTPPHGDKVSMEIF